jgi:hypothetical protein
VSSRRTFCISTRKNALFKYNNGTGKSDGVRNVFAWEKLLFPVWMSGCQFVSCPPIETDLRSCLNHMVTTIEGSFDVLR